MSKSTLKLAYFLKKFNDNFKNNKMRYISYRRVFSSNFNFFKHLSVNEDFQNLPEKDIVLNYFLKAERLYPGSSYLTSVKLVERIIGNYNKEKKNKTDINIFNLESYLKTKSKEEFVDIFLEILRFSGPDSTINCKASNNTEISVIKHNNPKFKIDIHESFRNVYFTNQKELTKNAIVSIMDVYIERESELFVLLDYAKENRVPLVLVCRGMSEYCANHLKSILLKNNLAVYPYISKFNDEDPFLFDDLASVLGVKKISSEYGDTINRNAIDKLSNKKVRIKPTEIEVFNPEKDIIKKLDESLSKNNDESIKTYLLKRKARIKCNVNEVLIPYDKIEMLSELKNLILCYNRLLISGINKDNKSLEKISSVKEENVSDILSEELFNKLNVLGLVIKLKG